MFSLVSGFSAEHALTISQPREVLVYVEHNMRAQSVVNPGMNKTTDLIKLTKLHELDSLLTREIRGQSHTLPRIISAVRRGELGLTKPARPRGSFLLLGPTGVGKTETVVRALTRSISN